MLCDHVLAGIAHGLLHAAKHEKIALLFNYGEGHPLRECIIKKIAATEKTAHGVLNVMRGATSAEAIAGFDEMISVLDSIVPKLSHPNDIKGLYEERAELLSMREKFRHLDEILAAPEGDEPEEEEAPKDTKSYLN